MKKKKSQSSLNYVLCMYSMILWFCVCNSLFSISYLNYQDIVEQSIKSQLESTVLSDSKTENWWWTIFVQMQRGANNEKQLGRDKDRSKVKESHVRLGKSQETGKCLRWIWRRENILFCGILHIKQGWSGKILTVSKN